MDKRGRWLLIFLTFAAAANIVNFYFTSKKNEEGEVRANINKNEKEARDATRKLPLQTGDLIFQTSESAQSKAIQLATHSPYSHCGIIFKYDQDYFVYEASSKVRELALDRWIAQGKDQTYVVKRLKEAANILTPENVKKLHKAKDTFYQKDYDQYFNWSNDEIYCSELIWKMYRDALGIEIGKLQLLKEFDFKDPEARKLLKQRYGDTVPYNDTVISPVSIFNSDILTEVKL